MNRNNEASGTSNAWTLWIVAASCVLHATEEILTGWQGWARETLGIVMPTTTFVVANALLVVAALWLARTGWQKPTLALVIPSATLVNALAFHILPTVLQGRRAPGIFTALFLYAPFSSWALIGAARDGVSRQDIARAMVAGTVMAGCVVLLARWQSG